MIPTFFKDMAKTMKVITGAIVGGMTVFMLILNFIDDRRLPQELEDQGGVSSRARRGSYAAGRRGFACSATGCRTAQGRSSVRYGPYHRARHGGPASRDRHGKDPSQAEAGLADHGPGQPREARSGMLEFELKELENIFALLILGGFVGMPSPPAPIAIELLPLLERETGRHAQPVGLWPRIPLGALMGMLEVD
ncbi:MAG: hypothetical protein M0C28_48790 [Candidatus Moduliflexus flocculans]|nr:hypothetical protein [Candidatus Moduliflexus flocculans]